MPPVNPLGPKTPALDPHREITLRKHEQPSEAERAKVSAVAHRRLIDTVERYKDVNGTGQEKSAEGDPRITERRGALSALLARKSDDPLYIDLLERLGDRV